MEQKPYYDFWYLKSQEVSLDGADTGRFAYELAVGVFADDELTSPLDDLRVAGLDQEGMLAFSIENPSILFEKLAEEGLGSIVDDIKSTGFYFILGEKAVI